MEGLDCVYGGYFREGTPQFGQEKKAGGGGDHFIVEDLLNFSNEVEDEEEEKDNGVNGGEKEKDSGVNGGDDGGLEADAGTGNSTDSSTVTAVDSCNSSFSGVGDAGLSDDLCEPHDELAELEWLSNFVEDSFSSEDLQKLQLISGVKAGPASGSGSNSSSSDSCPSAAGKFPAQQPSPFFLPEAAAVPGKARSKRPRAAANSWSSGLLVLSPTPATSSTDSDFILLNPITVRKAPKPAKKRDVTPLMAPSYGRKCLHCATDKTPQWRTGPMGPKTLCNACGVRYKSGRLVPEYRPAASPTFVLSKHSNSHRKVLELRRQKEQQQFLPQGVVPLFDGDPLGSAVASGDNFLIHQRLGPDFRQLT